MSDWRARAAALAGQLAALGGVDSQWATAFAEIPRHVFVPRFYADASTLTSTPPRSSTAKPRTGGKPAGRPRDQRRHCQRRVPDRTRPSVGQIWTSARDGRTLVRVSGDGGAWAEPDPATATQGGPTDLFDHIQHAATQWAQLDHPDPSRLGITAGPAGQTIWLDTPQHPIL